MTAAETRASDALVSRWCLETHSQSELNLPVRAHPHCLHHGTRQRAEGACGGFCIRLLRLNRVRLSQRVRRKAERESEVPCSPILKTECAWPPLGPPA